MAHTERRTARRFEIKLPMTVRWTSGAAVGEAQTESRDVSSRGVYFFLPKQVTSGSPVFTTSDFGTLSMMIELPGSLCRRMPAAPVFASTIETKLVSSVISFTFELFAPTVVAEIQRYEFLRGDDENAA